MRTSNLHFLIITLACILFACKDNNDIEPDANDAFVGSQRLITLSSEMDKFSGTDFECVIKENGTLAFDPNVHCTHHDHGEGHSCGSHGCGGHCHE